MSAARRPDGRKVRATVRWDHAHDLPSVMSSSRDPFTCEKAHSMMKETWTGVRSGRVSGWSADDRND